MSKAIRYLPIVLASALLVAGCQKEPLSPPAVTPHSQTNATAPEPNVANAINLPGVFVAKGIRLELLPNGRYRMREHAENANTDLDSEGRWSLYGGDLYLEPDNPSEPTRFYMTWSKDAFESNDGSYSLVRESPLAGSFAGTIPCADCPGIDVTLILESDGTYRRNDVYREKSNVNDTSGVCTTKDDGKKLLLATKVSSTWLAVDSNDALTFLDADGGRIDAKLNFTLQRTK